MINTFHPKLEILPDAQRTLWPRLKQTASLGFVLYGGTAISLRLGHRTSTDFDFFSEKPLKKSLLQTRLPILNTAKTIQDDPDTWSVIFVQKTGEVKLSFFGSISIGRIDDPELTSDQVLQVASINDLMATKLKVILQRAETKDYRDIAAMIESGTSLARGLASARLLYGSTFEPNESLRALTYFKDGDLETLPQHQKNLLIKAASTISKDNIPNVTLLSNRLSMTTSQNTQTFVRLPNKPRRKKGQGEIGE